MGIWGNPSISITPDLQAKRAWNVAATAAATGSATTATKSADAGKKWVITGFEAGFATASPTTAKVVTIKKGSTAVRWYVVEVGKALHVQLEPENWIFGDDNQDVSIELAASATSDATGYVSMHGFHIGER